ncbi:MAG: hypothetical protein IKK34_10695 [Clostridia bacterium]|nr:hypothetical protein [Clostridia bacterium]
MTHLTPEKALPILCARAKDLSASRAVLAIDGMAASGKTTLSTALHAAIPKSAVVHMDDFTLPFDMRFPGYFDALLSNADIQRFDREVLSPFLCGQRAVYRPYICHPQPGFGEEICIPEDTQLLIVEGAYCLHPMLAPRCALRVLSLIDPALQRQRILQRNGAGQLERFLSMWIPMENRHIQAHDLHAICEWTITSPSAGA